VPSGDIGFAFLMRHFHATYTRRTLSVLEISLRLSGIVFNVMSLRPRGAGNLHPGPATILLTSNFGQVVYSHYLPSPLCCKKLGYKGAFLDWINLMV